MTPARDMVIVLDEMIDHIDYVLAKAQNQSVSEFRANETSGKARSDRSKLSRRRADTFQQSSRTPSLKVRGIKWPISAMCSGIAISQSMPTSSGRLSRKACHPYALLYRHCAKAFPERQRYSAASRW